MLNVPTSRSRLFTLGAASLLCVAGHALGQCNPQDCSPVGTCNGPDVIVGDLTGPANYASSPTGTIDAFSVGTFSCNIGNVWLNWISSTNQHPVIGQSLFKFRIGAGNSTTFEQVGQSWLKHGFFALSENLCCTGCQPTDGTHLGIHCSDPYTAARNGSQAGLGPKYQVNAATGAFTYPPANPTWSGSVARRLQTKTSEIVATNSPTVDYFVAGQYVTADDAASGNKYNNESYRPCTMTGAGTNWNMTLTGTTQRAQQGIRAWANRVDELRASPSNLPLSPVNEADVFVPNDGLIIVASQATNLGGGLWSYEYAVQNMNSDRCVGAVTIPVPTGVTITNIGFHDVDYRDGDGIGNVNFSGVDWTPNMASGSVSTGSITWATQDFSVNQSANAIRWGTLYNFRFVANAAPAAGGGAATLTLFKPGTPTTINTTSIDVPGTLPVPCPCDYNHSGGLNSQDLFDFITDFLNVAPASDFNHDAQINSQDLFDFLGCFLAVPQGC